MRSMFPLAAAVNMLHVLDSSLCSTFIVSRILLHYKETTIITASKRSLRRLCFYTCLSVHGGGIGFTLGRGRVGFQACTGKGSLHRGGGSAFRGWSASQGVYIGGGWAEPTSAYKGRRHTPSEIHGILHTVNERAAFDHVH